MDTSLVHPKRACSPTEARLVFLWGTPRSGSTWLANILASHPRIFYSHEPLFKEHNKEANSVFFHEIKEDELLARGQQQRFLRALRQANPHTQRPPFFPKSFRRSPAGLQWAAWLAARSSKLGKALYAKLYSVPEAADVVYLVKEAGWTYHVARALAALDPFLLVIVRHPCAVVASQLRGLEAGWLDGSGDRSIWNELFAPQCQAFGVSPASLAKMDVTEFLAVRWLLENSVLLNAAGLHEKSIVISYEDLCRDPVAVAASTLRSLNLNMTEATTKFIHSSTAPPWWSSLVRGRRAYFGLRRTIDQAVNGWKTLLTQQDSRRILAIARRLPEFSRYWPVVMPSGFY